MDSSFSEAKFVEIRHFFNREKDEEEDEEKELLDENDIDLRELSHITDEN